MVAVCGLVILPRVIWMLQEANRIQPDGMIGFTNIVRSIPVVFFFTIAGVIVYVSTLSYLGFGVPPGTAELGAILSGGGRQYLSVAPWIAFWPGISLILILLVFVMAGDILLERLGFHSKAVWSKALE